MRLKSKQVCLVQFDEIAREFRVTDEKFVREADAVNEFKSEQIV